MMINVSMISRGKGQGVWFDFFLHICRGCLLVIFHLHDHVLHYKTVTEACFYRSNCSSRTLRAIITELGKLRYSAMFLKGGLPTMYQLLNMDTAMSFR